MTETMTRLLYALAQSELPPPPGPPHRGTAVTGAEADLPLFILAIVCLWLLAGLMFWLAHREAKL